MIADLRIGTLEERYELKGKVAAMFSKMKEFFAIEDGAVAVDWVVLCAAIVGLCVGGVDAAKGGVDNLAAALEQGISTESLQESQ